MLTNIIIISKYLYYTYNLYIYIIAMKTIFRLYAKTSKGNDPYLYNQLKSFGLKPQYQNLLHGYYFNANFNDLFKLSFQSFTIQNLYIQLGHRFPLSTTRSSSLVDNQQLVNQFLRKINFRNYLPMQRGLIQNISLKILIRESSTNLPSQNAIISIFQNYLQKEIIMKQYRKMFNQQSGNRSIQNYYDIKHIVQKKWQHQDAQQQQKLKMIQSQTRAKQIQGQQLTKNMINNNKNKQLVENLSQKQIQQLSQSKNQFQIPYNPHLILYIRRNHARLLLKLNKQSMHKFGWKKNVGWGPIRQTLTASILYRTGILNQFKSSNKITLWDPFCGSGTIPLVMYSMMNLLKVRKNVQDNFIWQNWPIYKPQYLKDFYQNSKKQMLSSNVKIFGSDIDINSTRNSVQNFKNLIQTNQIKTQQKKSQQQGTPFLKFNPSDKIFQILPNSIYIGCGDFQQLSTKFLRNKDQKVNIITNLPYLGQRSKQHHPLNQLHSIYKRFNTMIKQYADYIDNIFVIVDAEVNNRNHFIKMSKQEWRILQHFNNGGIQVCLLGWGKNRIGWKHLEVYTGKQVQIRQQGFNIQKTKNLQQYRQSMKNLESKRYQLPKHMEKYRTMTGPRRVRQKKKARHLRAAYLVFAKQRDKKQLFESYARKNLALRLSQRGETWKQKNLSILQGKIQQKQQLIKQEFESRIEQALKRSQQLKNRKKGKSQKVARKW